MQIGTDDLKQAVTATRGIVAGIHEGQVDLPTPCTEWTVRELLNHLIGSIEQYVSALREGAAPRPPAEHSDPDSVGCLNERYVEAADDLLAGFAEATPGAQLALPLGSTPLTLAVRLAVCEVLVHGWDLARATGQAYSVDNAVVERALEFAGPALTRLPANRRPFQPSVPIQGNAPAIDRLAAVLGRQV